MSSTSMCCKSDDCPVCQLCGGFENLLLCARCKIIWYCSKEHQIRDWKVHKKNCFKETMLANKDDPSGKAMKINNHSSQHDLDCSRDGAAAVSNNKVDSNPCYQQYNTGKVHMDAESGSMSTTDDTKSLGEYVVKCLNDYGICVVDNFLGEETGTKVLKEAKYMHQSGLLSDGELVNKFEAVKKVRGDQIAWTEKGDIGYENISILIQKLDNLVMSCSKRFEHYDIGGRTKAMVACYPGSGTYYMKHVDNSNEDGRCITSIYYLNKDWDVSRDGGLLRIFPAQLKQVADIEPCFDRMLFFWSDRRNPHEVQAAYNTRYAITVWYFDRKERLRAKLRHRLGEKYPVSQNQQEATLREQME